MNYCWTKKLQIHNILRFLKKLCLRSSNLSITFIVSDQNRVRSQTLPPVPTVIASGRDKTAIHCSAPKYEAPFNLRAWAMGLEGIEGTYWESELILARFGEGSVGQKQSKHSKYSLAELVRFVAAFKWVWVQHSNPGDDGIR